MINENTPAGCDGWRRGWRYIIQHVRSPFLSCFRLPPLHVVSSFCGPSIKREAKPGLRFARSHDHPSACHSHASITPCTLRCRSTGESHPQSLEIRILPAQEERSAGSRASAEFQWGGVETTIASHKSSTEDVARYIRPRDPRTCRFNSFFLPLHSGLGFVRMVPTGRMAKCILPSHRVPSW